VNTTTIKKGDRLPSVTATLKLNGVPYDLTGKTVTFRMWERGKSTLKVNATAVVVDAAAASVRYDWASGDTDTAGDFDQNWKVVGGDSKPLTFPNDGFDEVIVGNNP
jgi:hypothetical protein